MHRHCQQDDSPSPEQLLWLHTQTDPLAELSCPRMTSLGLARHPAHTCQAPAAPPLILTVPDQDIVG